MRFIGPGFILAGIGVWLAGNTAWGQATSQPLSTLRQWFNSTSKDPAPPADAPAVANPGPPAHYLRQSTCMIPFSIDASRNPPLELQLFVSTDKGVSWKFFGKANPSAGRFTYRASDDGEYWFALRTIQASQAPTDPKALQPGLKVIFDTQPPQLRFEVAADSDGMVSLTWGAEDANLDPTTFRVEYQTDPNGPWQMVTLPRGGRVDGRQVSGQHAMRWQRSAPALLRAEVRDRAGNQAVVSRTLEAAPERGPSAERSVPIAVAPPSAPNGAVGWPRDNVLPPRAKPAPPATSPRGGELPPPKPSADHPPSSVKNEPQRNPYFSTAVQAPRHEPSADAEGGAEFVETGRPEQLPGESPLLDPAVDQFPSSHHVPVVPPANAKQSLLRQPAHEPTPSADAATRIPSPTAQVPLPAGDRPRMTNSRQFSLDYEVDAISPSGIESVELWCTPDGGRTWKRWQQDDDRQSPIDVRLDRDGVFGFRIVIVANSQLATLTPQPGEPADIWVGVDTTRPSIRVTQVNYGQGDRAGQLDIQWQAFDTGLADRPITLSFSEQENGPWHTIAAGLPNSGQYYWPADPRIPRAIYLKAQAIDDAGNIGEHQVDGPISMAGLFPQGRIRGIRVPTPDRNASNDVSKR
jgi:hypothetical protein